MRLPVGKSYGCNLRPYKYTYPNIAHSVTAIMEEKLKGRIDVQNDEKGACFTLYIPSA